MAFDEVRMVRVRVRVGVRVGAAVVLIALVGTACGGGDRPEVTAAAGPGGAGSAVVPDEPPPPARREHSRHDANTVVFTAAPGETARELRLASTPSNELTAALAPRIVLRPDLGVGYYNSWEAFVDVDGRPSLADQGVDPAEPVGVPVLRSVDLASGADAAVARGAYGPAVAADGTLAYAQGDPAGFAAGGDPYPSRLLVRRSDGTTEEWDRAPDLVIPVAWAGDVLLAYRMHEGESLELAAFTGPGRVAWSTRAYLLAVAPDGARAAIAEPQPSPQTISIVDLASGEVVASTVLDAPVPVRYGGDWEGDRLVAPADSRLHRFRVDGAGIVHEGAVELGDGMLAHVALLHDDGVTVWAAQRTGRAEPVPGATPAPDRDDAASAYRYVQLECAPAGPCRTLTAGAPREVGAVHVNG
jgi:hypothetical protein